MASGCYLPPLCCCELTVHCIWNVIFPLVCCLQAKICFPGNARVTSMTLHCVKPLAGLQDRHRKTKTLTLLLTIPAESLRSIRGDIFMSRACSPADRAIECHMQYAHLFSRYIMMARRTSNTKEASGMCCAQEAIAVMIHMMDGKCNQALYC